MTFAIQFSADNCYHIAVNHQNTTPLNDKETKTHKCNVKGYIEGMTTRLCMPSRNNTSRTMQLTANNG